jgi:hypothetical protein
MSKEWKDKGMTGSISNMFSSILPGATGHVVQNKKTGEYRKVWKGSNQSVGDAVKRGQFNDRKSRKK